MKSIGEALRECLNNEKVYYINNDNDDLVVVQSHITIWSKNHENGYSLKNKVFFNYNVSDCDEGQIGGQLFSRATDNMIVPNDEVRAKYGNFENIRFKRCFDVNIPRAIKNWNNFFNSALKKYDELSVLRNEVCFNKYRVMQYEYFHLLFDDKKTEADISNYMKLIDKEYCRRLSDKLERRYFN